MAGFVAYFRVSTERQGESGLGLQAQRDAVLRLIGESPLLAEFTEIESGKATANRPQLKAALELCKRKRATLVIAKLDRLSRNLHFISGLIESGIEFKAADNPHANKMTVQMLAVFAEHEREMISQRTKQALKAAKANGTVLGNPRWQESLVEARKAKNPVSPAPQVIEMMLQHRNEGLTLRAIADKMNGLGLKTPNGCQWYAGTIRKVIQSATT